MNTLFLPASKGQIIGMLEKSVRADVSVHRMMDHEVNRPLPVAMCLLLMRMKVSLCWFERVTSLIGMLRCEILRFGPFDDCKVHRTFSGEKQIVRMSHLLTLILSRISHMITLLD